jgi:hypothetical protein
MEEKNNREKAISPCDIYTFQGSLVLSYGNPGNIARILKSLKHSDVIAMEELNHRLFRPDMEGHS